MSHDARAAFRLCSDVRFRHVRDEALVLRQGDAEVLGLNELGARVLELVIDGLPLEALLDVLAGEYRVERDRLERDVGSFLDELLAGEVIEPCDPPAETPADSAPAGAAP